MEVSSACDVTISETLGAPYGSKQTYANQNQSCNSMNNATDESVISKLGNALTAILHVEDVKLQLSGCVSLSAVDDFRRAEKNMLLEEFNADESKHLNATAHESSNKSGILPCSETTPYMLVSVDGDDEILDSTSLHPESQCSENMDSEPPASLLVFSDGKDGIPDKSLHSESENTENLDLKSPASPSAPRKPVSAMKGNREKLGIPLKKLNVTWDPDVYDPPATSLSHTVRSNSQQRSRNKKASKHKHKGKSSQAINNGKRHQKHGGKSDIRSKALLTSERSYFAGYKCSLGLMDFAVAGHDSNCGSSFLKTSLSEVHIPVAEAT